MSFKTTVPNEVFNLIRQLAEANDGRNGLGDQAREILPYLNSGRCMLNFSPATPSEHR